MSGGFFRGRYGADNLGYALLLGAIMLCTSRYTALLGAGLGAFALYRMLSRNTGKRIQELNNFNQLIYRGWAQVKAASRSVSGFFSRLAQRGRYAFVRCPSCRCRLRLPRTGKVLRVTCPKCAHIFNTKT